eukprot:3074967-Rhodomonas_salina.1
MAEMSTMQARGGTMGGDEAAVGCHLFAMVQIARVSLMKSEEGRKEERPHDGQTASGQILVSMLALPWVTEARLCWPKRRNATKPPPLHGARRVVLSYRPHQRSVKRWRKRSKCGEREQEEEDDEGVEEEEEEGYGPGEEQGEPPGEEEVREEQGCGGRRGSGAEEQRGERGEGLVHEDLSRGAWRRCCSRLSWGSPLSCQASMAKRPPGSLMRKEWLE